MAVRRPKWPIRIVPYPDELRSSWLARISQRYGVPLRHLAADLGIGEGSRRAPALLIDAAADRWCAALGVPRHMFPLSDRDPDWPCPPWSPIDLRTPSLGRYCHRCLSDRGYWRRSWLRAWVLGCPEHMIRLSRTCPSCGKRPWSDTAWQSLLAAPDQCLNRLTTATDGGRRRVHPICGADLGVTQDVPLSLDELHGQNLLTQLLDDARADVSPSRRCHGFAVTPAMRLHVFTELLTENWMAEKERGSASLAAALAITARRFDAFDQTSLIDRAVPRPRKIISPLGPGQKVRRRPHSPIVTAACLAAEGTNFAPATQLQFRTGRTHPSYPIDWLPGQELSLLLPEHRTEPLIVPLEWVPQSLWRHPALGTCTPERSVVLAMCLLKLGRSARWSTIADWLGLPRSVCVWIRTELADLRRTGNWQRILGALEQVFDTLRRAPPPIDYCARRRIASTPGLIDRVLRAAVDTESIPEVTPAVYMRFWALFTGGYTGSEPDHSSRTVGDHTAIAGAEPPWQAIFELTHKISPQPIEGPLTWEPSTA